jgi:peroxiredoxin
MRKLLIVLLCVGTLAAVAQGPSSDRRAPGFSLMDSNWGEHDLADYRGKVVLLAFLQTTCQHCATFSEKLQLTQQKYGDRVAVLAVLTPPDDFAKGNAFAAQHKLSYQVLFDAGQMSYSYTLSRTLNFPRLYIIDGNGMIKWGSELTPQNQDMFEGNGLGPFLDKLLKK